MSKAMREKIDEQATKNTSRVFCRPPIGGHAAMKSTGIAAAHNNGWLLPLISSGCDPRVHSLQIDGYIAIAPFAIYRRMQDAQMDRPLPRSHHAGTLLDLIYGAVADPHTWPELLRRVSDHLGAVGGILVHIPPAGRGRGVNIVGRLSEELSDIY